MPMDNVRWIEKKRAGLRQWSPALFVALALAVSTSAASEESFQDLLIFSEIKRLLNVDATEENPVLLADAIELHFSLGQTEHGGHLARAFEDRFLNSDTKCSADIALRVGKQLSQQAVDTGIPKDWKRARSYLKILVERYDLDKSKSEIVQAWTLIGESYRVQP